MNPLNIFQMMKNGNPQQFLQQMMGNNQIMRNPLMKNTIEMQTRLHGVTESTQRAHLEEQVQVLLHPLDFESVIAY